ncbi:MAG TPA: N-acetyltransferase [Elusimicrobia bacterium]|nr:N-acetyltransferase [Elusimicrobiota bacterium]
MRARKALLPDASAIHGLIFEYSRDNTLIPRSLTEIHENIRDFTVIENRDRIVGCGALHIYGKHLAEVRSIAVWSLYRGRNAGSILIKAMLEEAKQHRIACVCLFTRVPKFFAQLGFKKVKNERLPDKVYKDCRSCKRRDECDEVAMIRGRLPELAGLEIKPRKSAAKRKGKKK